MRYVTTWKCPKCEHVWAIKTDILAPYSICSTECPTVSEAVFAFRTGSYFPVRFSKTPCAFTPEGVEDKHVTQHTKVLQ